MLPCFVMLDLETTGGSAVRDRITEIAAVRVENGVEVDRWSTLVNPGVSIPSFIQSLTGITDAMVEDAPTFAQVAPRLLELLDGAVFVAHNVGFDHGFVVNELARLEKPLKVERLCTVRLSRKLYPQHKGHGLDAIMQRHGLRTLARHRAMGDVEVVLQWLQLAQAELGTEAVQREAAALLQGGTSVPPQLETPVEDIPDTPGVYLFYGEGRTPLYVGKSVNMRTRVLAHFQSAAKVAREARIAQEIRRIEWHDTAGELGALLLQTRLVKELKPLHNRKSSKKAQVDLVQQTLQGWPHAGRIGIREHHARTGRTDVHVFDQWCHVATVHSAEDLDDVRHSRQALAFDLETYRVLAKRLAALTGRDSTVFPLENAHG
ncbi:exonuclease domain-containing protein [Rhodoferax saidenbachensis]|uniref:DNA-directed DNA polymerase n=1 Tax=Rhodoferax saidenbachensis TaxID=1484693 RepID=A0ABU1ZK98_9BURK|nr:exonuclease domain-containing protein [Rhodoferax saidenbachensis]MDR7305366.1 DNA polymerase III epsilon subunit family exonuclease [Rhodoferax saidenbachensis]